MANNFVSEANATDLMNAINQKKDTRPDTITWDEWIALTDEEREGTHYIITNVPASFSSKDAIFALRNVTLEFTNKTAVITDTRVTPDAYLFTFFYNEAVAQAAGIECTWGNGTITFTVAENPTSDIILDILAILPALATPTEGSGGHTIVGPTGTEMAQEDKLQFTGDVTVTDDSTNGKTVVNITGGGHTIQNSQGTNMPSRSTMQFADAFLSDDSSALKTEIHMMQQAMTRAAFEDAQNLPDGMYPIKEEDPTVISSDMVTYGDGTVEQALDDINTRYIYERRIEGNSSLHFILSTYSTGAIISCAVRDAKSLLMVFSNGWLNIVSNDTDYLTVNFDRNNYREFTITNSKSDAGYVSIITRARVEFLNN